MSYFDRAIKYVLQHEGGYQNDPSDTGNQSTGEFQGTNFGITAKNYPHLNIRELTQEQAIEIYRRDYWRPIYDEMTDGDAACKLFDMAVNMGHRQAHKLLQRATGNNNADGIFGNVTLGMANATPDLVDRLCAAQAEFYQELVRKRPVMGKFLKGWLRRAEWRP